MKDAFENSLHKVKSPIIENTVDNLKFEKRVRDERRANREAAEEQVLDDKKDVAKAYMPAEPADSN